MRDVTVKRRTDDTRPENHHITHFPFKKQTRLEQAHLEALMHRPPIESLDPRAFTMIDCLPYLHRLKQLKYLRLAFVDLLGSDELDSDPSRLLPHLTPFGALHKLNRVWPTKWPLSCGRDASRSADGSHATPRDAHDRMCEATSAE
jgi:hypothetical protein